VYEKEEAMKNCDKSLCNGFCKGTLQEAFEVAFETYVTKVKK